MNINNPEIFSIVDRVCKDICKRFTFDSYDEDDIYQESILICEDIINKYDGERPLENFLRVSLKNRLMNFKRDNTTYYKFVCPECNNKNCKNCEYCIKYRIVYEIKKNINSPLNIDEIEDEQLQYNNIDEYIEYSELHQLINFHLPIEMRADYLRIMSGVYINKSRRDEIISRITDILKQNDFIDED